MTIPDLVSLQFEFSLSDRYSIAQFIDTYHTMCMYTYSGVSRLVFLVSIAGSSRRCEIIRTIRVGHNNKTEYLGSVVRYFSSHSCRKPKIVEYVGLRNLELGLNSLL